MIEDNDVYEMLSIRFMFILAGMMVILLLGCQSHPRVPESPGQAGTGTGTPGTYGQIGPLGPEGAQGPMGPIGQ